MTKNIENLCNFVLAFKKVKYTKSVIVICFTPFILLVGLLLMLILLSSEEAGAVIANSPVCAAIGRDVIKQEGSAVDVAIAVLLCEGVASPNSAGIGGGFVALIYANGRFNSITATATVPRAIQNIRKFNASYLYGPKSIGVPGELLGYWEMHQKYGILPWKRLFEPTIKLCLRGIAITHSLSAILNYSKLRLQSSETTRNIFRMRNSRKHTEGTKLKFLALANTLDKIATKGPAIFYKGKLGDAFVGDVLRNGGLITKTDLENYTVIWENTLPTIRIKGRFKVITTALPTTGAVVAFVLNLIKNVEFKKPENFWHTYAEALKFAFGHLSRLGDDRGNYEYAEIIRQTYKRLIDPEYASKIRSLIKKRKFLKDYGDRILIREVAGSTNICVATPSGDVVVATTEMGHQFGSSFASSSTGIILNNILSRFVHIRKWKVSTMPIFRPVPGTHLLSMHSPAIVIRTHSNDPYFVLGASGGPQATSRIINAIIKYVLIESSIREATGFKYIHYRPFPGRLEYEEIDYTIHAYLKEIGHNISYQMRYFNNLSRVSAIGFKKKPLDTTFDKAMDNPDQVILPIMPYRIIFLLIFSSLASAMLVLTLFELLGLRKTNENSDSGSNL